MPIRLRLTLAFALAMAVVLVVTGGFLYLRLASSLDEGIDEGLEARAAELAGPTAIGSGSLRITASGADGDERFVQVLDAEGRVVGGTVGLDRALLDRADLAEARSGARWFVRDDVEGVDGRARILAMGVGDGRDTLLLVGASLEDRDDALGELLVLLLVVGPVALLFSSALGYALAREALRPVESMRAGASAVSASEPGRRLALPRSNDEVTRLGETLNEMLGRLEAALERERTFVADASHELRSPLALLKAELDLALRRPRSRADLEATLRSAAAETDRLARLADDLLLLARADQGELPLRRTQVRAADLLTRTARRFSQRAEADGRRIDVRAPEELTLSGDELRLDQALGNLAENALRHGQGAIELGASERDGRVELHVRDAGPGFPAEYVHRAFERFSRADTARSGDGAGLGLTIVELIAKAHGGVATAANRPGGGADVTIAIPKG